MVILIIPMNALTFYEVKNQTNYNFTDTTKIISIIFAAIFGIILIIQLIFKRNYMGVMFSCHNRQDRSCKHTNKYLHICARCTGILLGILLTPLLMLFNFNKLFLLLGIIPLLVDGLLQHYTKYESNNFKRIITGLVFAPSFILIITLSNILMSKLNISIIKLIYKIFIN